MLEIRHLIVGYPEHPVLRELSLFFPEASVTAIVGPNGCGKSTLLKAAVGILPAAGQILLQGHSLAGLSSQERARLISFLPQNRPVPEITVQSLVLHGRYPYLSYPRRCRPEDLAAAAEAMAQLGISHLAHRDMPSLSGGERQKVYIAMLLAQNTPVVLMDEPTTYLDPAHKFQVMEISRKLSSLGKTVILVLHDLDLAMQYADRIAVMEHGRIAFCGPPEEVSARGILEQVFDIRMGQLQTPEGIQYYFLPKAGLP